MDQLQVALTHDDMQRLAQLRDAEMLSIPTPIGELVFDRGEASTVLDAIWEVLRYRLATLQASVRGEGA